MSKKTIVSPVAVAAPVAAPVAVTRDAAIGTLINEAGQAAASMLSKCKEAAAGAAAQLNPAQPMAERIAGVVSLYAADFAAAGHNVKALFVDALTLHASGQTPVSVNIIGKDGKRVDSHVTAAQAVDMSKHNMRDAAKQVREAHGIGRRTGGGRKAAVSAAVAAAPAAPDMIRTQTDQFSAWLDSAADYMADAVFHPRIVAHFISIGYSLNKAAKGKIVKGAASA